MDNLIEKLIVIFKETIKKHKSYKNVKDLKLINTQNVKKIIKILPNILKTKNNKKKIQDILKIGNNYKKIYKGGVNNEAEENNNGTGNNGTGVEPLMNPVVAEPLVEAQDFEVTHGIPVPPSNQRIYEIMSSQARIIHNLRYKEWVYDKITNIILCICVLYVFVFLINEEMSGRSYQQRIENDNRLESAITNILNDDNKSKLLKEIFKKIMEENRYINITSIINGMNNIPRNNLGGKSKKKHKKVKRRRKTKKRYNKK